MPNRDQFFKGIRLRFVIGFSVFILLTICFISSYFYFAFNQKLDMTSKSFAQNELVSTVKYIQEKKYLKKDMVQLLDELSSVTTTGKYKLYFTLFNSDGSIYAKSPKFTPDTLFFSNLTGEIDLEKIYHSESLQENQKNYYFSETKAFYDASGELLYLQFTIDPFHHIEIKNYLIDTILISIPILLLFIFLSSVILTKWTLKPIIHLTRTVQSFSLTTGKRLLPLSKNNDEIDKLSQTLNNLVIQNRESFETLILFTATLSHELRLPITAIKGEAEVCLSKPRTVIEYQSILQSVIEELDKLTKMINRLFSLNRIDLGDDPIQWQVIDIGKTLNTLILFYDALAETRKINLTGVFELNTFFIKGDVDKIQEIFSNLIENAIKYTGENGQISVSISRQGNQIAISIKDTGIGISAADQDRIFDRFFQVQKDRTGNQSGTGLGLSIVKQLLTLHRGSITVQSELQKGSCFTVYLPVSS